MLNKGSDVFFTKNNCASFRFFVCTTFLTTHLKKKQLNNYSFKKTIQIYFYFSKHILAHLKLLSNNNVLLYLFGKFEIFCFCSVFCFCFSDHVRRLKLFRWREHLLLRDRERLIGNINCWSLIESNDYGLKFINTNWKQWLLTEIYWHELKSMTVE